MDDKLYYVEGPQGQVLGPMNMIHIMEGIAANAILDDARICEVGGQEWIELADVAHTRDEDEGFLATAAQLEAEPEPEFDHSPLEDPAVTAEADDELTFTPSSAPHDEDSLDLMPTMPMASGPEESVQVDETPVADSTPWAQPDQPEAAPASARWADEDVAAAELPASAHAYDSKDLPASARPYDSEDLPASARPYDPEDLPASARPYEEVTAGADDFALQMPAEDEMDEEPEYVPAEPRRKSKAWVAPVVVLVTLPVIAGVYLLTGGTIPIIDYRLDLGGEPVADVPLGPTDAAWQLLNAGKPTEAIAAFDGIIETEPENARAHHGKGLAQLALENPASAVKSLEQASALGPEDRKVLVDLGRAQLDAGNPDGAVRAADKALALDPTDRPAMRLAGIARFEKGDWSGAAKNLTPFVKAVPADSEARLRLAQAMAAEGRVEAAVAEMGGYLAGHAEDFEAQRERLDWMLQLGQQGEAAKLYATYAADRPESAPAQLLAGIAHGKTEEGAAHLQRALELDPSMTEARRLLDGTLAALHPKTPAPAPRPTRPAPTPPADNGALAARIESIRGALQRESFSTARSAIESARKELAGDATARRNLDLWEAICTFQEGDLSAALRRFEALNTSASYAASGFGKGTVENWIANVHVSRGNARAAVTVLDAVGPDSPDEYAKARVWEGVALASLGMDDLALRTWTRVSTDVGRRVSPEGRAAVKTAEFLTGAISEKDYRVAVSTTGDWANDMYYFLGFSARRAHDAEGARDNFQRSLDQSRGKEFPYYLSRAEMDGTGLTGEW